MTLKIKKGGKIKIDVQVVSFGLYTFIYIFIFLIHGLWICLLNYCVCQEGFDWESWLIINVESFINIKMHKDFLLVLGNGNKVGIQKF